MLTAQQIPTTGRKTAFQVHQWGFDDIASLAASLPQNAVIIDVGAGLSQFGDDVVRIRRDVGWVNVDPFYAHSSTDKPKDSKVKYLPVDIVEPGKLLKDLTGKADTVYSYWMLPHLSLDGHEPAIKAIRHMYSLLCDDGMLIVGPARQFGLGILSPFRYKGTLQFSKSELNDEVIRSIVAKTKLWWLPRKIQLLSNMYNIHLLKKFVGGKG